MEILKEASFDAEDSYGVIYQKGHKQKIVTVNNLDTFDSEDVNTGGTLEIRTCDFEFGFEKLLFYDGELEGHEDEYEFRSRKNMTDVESNLTYFAKEFKFAFETNPKLKEYLSTIFKELMKYLDIDKL